MCDQKLQGSPVDLGWEPGRNFRRGRWENGKSRSSEEGELQGCWGIAGVAGGGYMAGKSGK